MSAHTPGPWHCVIKFTSSENHRGFYISNGKWGLAEVQPGDADGNLGEANARLISAAPDLLAALIGLGEAMRDFDGADPRLMQPAALAARAAIAKAQGRP